MNSLKCPNKVFLVFYVKFVAKIIAMSLTRYVIHLRLR